MEATSVQKRKNRVMDEEEGALGSSSADSSGNSTGSSASSDLTDDTASSSSSSSPPSSSSCSPPPRSRGPLFEMSTLKEQLPFKRGLSKFYQGKSQSFASFSDIKSFEDLVKPERRPLKRLKTSRSCGEGWDGNGSLLNLECCGRRRVITRRDPKSSSLSSSAGARRRVCSLASKPPLHPRRPSNSDQPLWFA